MEFITVSAHPTLKKKMTIEELAEYDVVVNVSDHFDLDLANLLKQHKIESHWFPLGESYQMPLENIYAAMFILWHAEQNNKTILLHCVAGRNRSQMVFDCYRYMMTGKIDEKSSLMLNVNDNQLPGIYRLEVFLKKCLEVFQNPEVADGAFID